MNFWNRTSGGLRWLWGFVAVLWMTGQASSGAAQTVTESGRIGPQSGVVYEIIPGEGLVRRVSSHPLASSWHLTAAAAGAVELAPLWVQVALKDKLGQLPDELQQALADTLQAAQSEDPRYVDEVAFSIAHLAVEDLTYVDDDDEVGFDPEILLDNVRYLYAADALFDYVELVEVGDPETDDDFYTTARYDLLDEGQPTVYELTRREYYWWVVHPKISADPVVYVHPSSDQPTLPSEGGRFWREYLLADRGTPHDPTRPFVLKAPQEITDSELMGWGPSAQGYLISTEMDPIRCIRRSSDGRPVMLRYTYRAPAAGGYNGTVLATTMPVEIAYREGQSDLLRNMVSLGDGNVFVIPLISPEPFLVIKDRDPFGQPTVEQALTERGYDFDVMDSTAFAAIATADELEALGYEKVIVPSDQPRLLYERLAANRTVIDGWVGRSDRSDDMVFQFHGAVDPVHLPQDDWTDLALPGGLQGRELDVTSDDLYVWGYPRLLDVMEGTTHVWDGATYPALNGNRTLAATALALDRLGYLVSQNLDDNVAELPADFAGPDGDCYHCYIRSLNAVRVMYGHYENCGGIGILFTALARTALIPAAKVSGGPEDHEWNEFYLADSWWPFQVDWSDGATRIAVEGNSQDKDFGGGKDLSMVFTYRGDGLTLNDIGRYSQNVMFDVTVHDASGNPVDGARILLATETYYDENQLMLATIEHTDLDGRATFPVGDLQNFYLRVDSPAGHWPDPEHVQWVACADANATGAGGQPCPATAPWDPSRDMPNTAVPDSTVTLDLVVDGGGGAVPLEAETTTEASPLPAAGHLAVSLTAPHQVRVLDALLTGSEVVWGGAVDVMLLDAENFARFRDGAPFQTHDATRISGPSNPDPDPENPFGRTVIDRELAARSSNWYLLLSNTRKVASAQHYNIEIDLQPHGSDAGVDRDGDLDGDATAVGGGGGGCGCRFGVGVFGVTQRFRGAPAARSFPRAALLLLILLGGIVFRLRSRRPQPPGGQS